MIENINNIIKAIDKINDVSLLLNNEVFEINSTDLMNVLSDNIYGRRFTRYILFKLDYLYGNTDKINVPNIITTEHILPQTPKQDSQWKIDFSDQEREQWTNKIGNLVLISRKKNSSQGRMDFSDKKTKYFKNNKPITSEAFWDSLTPGSNLGVKFEKGFLKTEVDNYTLIDQSDGLLIAVRIDILSK